MSETTDQLPARRKLPPISKKKKKSKKVAVPSLAETILGADETFPSLAGDDDAQKKVGFSGVDQTIPHRERQHSVIASVQSTPRNLGSDQTSKSHNAVADIAAISAIGIPLNVGPNIVRSEFSDRVYIQHDNSFKVITNKRLAEIEEEGKKTKAKLEAQEEEMPTYSSALSAVSLGIEIQRFFIYIATYCHGVLAGFAFAHTLIVFFLSNAKDFPTKDVPLYFIEHYQHSAIPIRSIYTFLLLIVLVSLLDRYDISSMTLRDWGGALKLRNAGLVIFIYLAAFILSVITVAEDDRIGLFEDNRLIWRVQKEREDYVEHWKRLSLGRTILILIGWLTVSYNPTYSRLMETLEEIRTRVQTKT